MHSCWRLCSLLLNPGPHGFCMCFIQCDAYSCASFAVCLSCAGFAEAAIALWTCLTLKGSCCVCSLSIFVASLTCSAKHLQATPQSHLCFVVCTFGGSVMQTAGDRWACKLSVARHRLHLLVHACCKLCSARLRICMCARTRD
jgi:hypothetical protein